MPVGHPPEFTRFVNPQMLGICCSNLFQIRAPHAHTLQSGTEMNWESRRRRGRRRRRRGRRGSRVHGYPSTRPTRKVFEDCASLSTKPVLAFRVRLTGAAPLIEAKIRSTRVFRTGAHSYFTWRRWRRRLRLPGRTRGNRLALASVVPLSRESRADPTITETRPAVRVSGTGLVDGQGLAARSDGDVL